MAVPRGKQIQLYRGWRAIRLQARLPIEQERKVSKIFLRGAYAAY